MPAAKRTSSREARNKNYSRSTNDRIARESNEAMKESAARESAAAESACRMFMFICLLVIILICIITFIYQGEIATFFKDVYANWKPQRVDDESSSDDPPIHNKTECKATPTVPMYMKYPVGFTTAFMFQAGWVLYFRYALRASFDVL